MTAETYTYPETQSGRGFVTAYLPDYPGGDWVCVTDFCGTSSRLGYHDMLNVCAYWSPSRKLVAFGGQWVGTPTMTADTEPSEQACWDWAEAADTIFARRVRAAAKRRAGWEAKSAATDAHYLARGYNWANVTFTRPDGATVTISQCVGLQTWQTTLRAACYTMQAKQPPGTRITGWRFETGLTEKQVDARRSRADRALAKVLERD